MDWLEIYQDNHCSHMKLRHAIYFIPLTVTIEKFRTKSYFCCSRWNLTRLLKNYSLQSLHAFKHEANTTTWNNVLCSLQCMTLTKYWSDWHKRRQVVQKERERDTNGICFTLEVTEYFIHQLSEADWLMGACDSRCTEASKTQPPSFYRSL
jgi:hypothetical protein